ncbi:Hypothetical protein PHPALM_8498 [Phytophthora palmivora]|uniref:Uncharacterized protein n=1 Tax=Phytophthora palmivora TaxID=4796 RepID=A0A2P4Y9Q1_9STRA|nr:Hypothetical protein PHPALM_8498 [Phytophthora palmivora]
MRIKPSLTLNSTTKAIFLHKMTTQCERLAQPDGKYTINITAILWKKLRQSQKLTESTLSFCSTNQDPEKILEDLDDITEKLERQKPIREHEILHVIGLLVVRTLCEHTDGLAKHWAGCTQRHIWEIHKARNVKDSDAGSPLHQHQ